MSPNPEEKVSVQRKVKVVQDLEAMSAVRTDGFLIAISPNEVLIRFYYDSPGLPEGVHEWPEAPPDEGIVIRAMHTALSLDPQVAHALGNALTKALPNEG